MTYTTEYTINEELQQGVLIITLENGKQLGFAVNGAANAIDVDNEIHSALFSDFHVTENIERFAALCVADPETAVSTYYNTRIIP